MVGRAFQGLRHVRQIVTALSPGARLLDGEGVLVDFQTSAPALLRERSWRVRPDARLHLVLQPLTVHKIVFELLKCLFWDVYLILGLPDLIILLQLLNQLTMVEKRD